MERTIEGGALIVISVSIKDMAVERKGVDGDNETWKIRGVQWVSRFGQSLDNQIGLSMDRPASPRRRKRQWAPIAISFAGASIITFCIFLT